MNKRENVLMFVKSVLNIIILYLEKLTIIDTKFCQCYASLLNSLTWQPLLGNKHHNITKIFHNKMFAKPLNIVIKLVHTLSFTVQIIL